MNEIYKGNSCRRSYYERRVEENSKKVSTKSEVQKKVVSHNVKQFLLRKLSICRICLETEDDSNGTAYLNPISSAIWTFLNLTDYELPHYICTKCERIVVDFMILMEMAEESNDFIQQVKDEMVLDTSTKYENLEEEFSDPEKSIETESIPEKVVTNEEMEDIIEYYNDYSDKRENQEHFKTPTYTKFNEKFPHKCPMEGCSKSFGLPSLVHRHVNRVHPGKKQNLIFNATELTRYRQKSDKLECFYCGHKYWRQCYLEEHIRKVHEAVNLECNICGKMFNEIRLKVHMKIHQKLYECNECGKRFVEKFLLKKHLLADHLGISSYLCSECGENFNTAQKLRRHVVKSHKTEVKKKSGIIPDDQKGYCKYCGLRFLDKTELVKHVKEHTNILKCMICAKKFASAISLDRHQKNHRNVEYPFECKDCESRYETKALLKRHINTIHVKQQWLCTVCQKGFTSLRALEIHQTSHEGKGLQEYQCFLCEKRFSATRRLKDHLIANHTESRFECSKCPVKCISHRGFEAHLRKAHPGMYENQPDVNQYFKRDEPRHTQIMEKYQLCLRKLSKERQEAKKHRQDQSVQKICVEVLQLPNDFIEKGSFKVEEDDTKGKHEVSNSNYTIANKNTQYRIK